MVLLEVFTVAIDATVSAERLMGSAYFSSVKDAVHVKGISPLRGHQGFEFVVALVRSLPPRPAQTRRDAMHVHVNRQHLDAKCIQHYAFCNLFRHARKTHQEFLYLLGRSAFENLEVVRTEFIVD
jgi:hypothetical protein